MLDVFHNACLGEPSIPNAFTVFACAFPLFNVGDDDLVGILKGVAASLIHEEVFTWLWGSDPVPCMILSTTYDDGTNTDTHPVTRCPITSPRVPAALLRRNCVQ